jgi:FKBP-type peptidyl-prolyl cis-trans isomerase FkpA
MRNLLLSSCVALAVWGCSESAKPAGGSTTPTANAPLTTDTDKEFYAIGLNIGKSLAEGQVTPSELDMIKRGMTDQVNGTKPEVDGKEWMMPAQKMMRDRQMAKVKQAAQAQKDKDAHAIDDALKQPKSEKLANGAVYVEEVAGTGDQPTENDTVSVNYTGTLLDGTEFDSTKSRGQPAKFPLKGVVACWTQGIQKLKVGGKGKLVCPSDVAYGDQGRPGKIPGGATLVFEVELLEVIKGTATPPGMPMGMNMGQPGMPGVHTVQVGQPPQGTPPTPATHLPAPAGQPAGQPGGFHPPAGQPGKPAPVPAGKPAPAPAPSGFHPAGTHK